MKLDVHVTTCHRHDVKCRPRPHEGPNWNVKAWTREERIEISKVSVNSIIRFTDLLKTHGHDVSVTILDDGSNVRKANEWLESLQGKVGLKLFPARDSSAGVNDHFYDLNTNPPDYICHFEDDNILFNPLNLDWLTIIDNIRRDSGNIKVFTFRSGLPVSPEDRGYRGSWAPIGASPAGKQHSILFRMMGNAHHIIKWSDYKSFFPLMGNTGSCEEVLNKKLDLIGLNAEPQIHVHAFHSHMWEYKIDTEDLSRWHKTGEGFEYGIYNMDQYLKEKNKIVSTIFTEFPKVKESLTLTDYAY